MHLRHTFDSAIFCPQRGPPQNRPGGTRAGYLPRLLWTRKLNPLSLPALHNPRASGFHFTLSHNTFAQKQRPLAQLGHQ
jgi:hypothetical protein